MNNSFYPYFVGPNAIFNEPDSLYSQPTIQQINLLRPYPQFPGNYEGFADGSQRPNVSGDPRSSFSIKDVVNSLGTDNDINVSAFTDPGDQIACNEPRFNSALIGDGIRNLDFSLFKNFSFHDRYRVQLREEFFNVTNTVRFRI